MTGFLKETEERGGEVGDKKGGKSALDDEGEEGVKECVQTTRLVGRQACNAQIWGMGDVDSGYGG